jgi:hypothetical protein
LPSAGTDTATGMATRTATMGITTMATTIEGGAIDGDRYGVFAGGNVR